MTLVDTVKKLQDKDDVDSVVCAFDMDSPALLMLPQERQIHLEDEVDYLVECPFTDEIRQMRARILSGILSSEPFTQLMWS